MVARYELGELVHSFGEVHFGGDHGVEPAFDNSPDSWGREEKGVRIYFRWDGENVGEVHRGKIMRERKGERLHLP